MTAYLICGIGCIFENKEYGYDAILDLVDRLTKKSDSAWAFLSLVILAVLLWPITEVLEDRERLS